MVTFKLNVELFIVAVDLFVFTAFKECFSEEKHMKDSSHGEHIAGGLDVLWFSEFDDLWCHVARRPTAEEEVLVDICASRQSEIDDNWLQRPSPQHYVLRLDISM